MGLEKIAEYKKKRNMTTCELSYRSGVPLGTLNKILSGATKDPKLETLKAIARVLGLSLDDFDDTNKSDKLNIDINAVPTYDDVITVYTRSRKNLSQEEKMRLARIILSSDEDGE